MASPFDELEQLIGRDVGRNISQLVSATRGQLASAARSIADHPAPKLAIITGFFVPATNPPAAETDGPIGAVILAAVLERSGIQVELVTDDKCCSMLQVARDTMKIDAPVVSVSTAEDVDDLRTKYLDSAAGFSHVLSIERPGPAASGRVRNFKGHDLTDLTAPLHCLFELAPESRGYVTIAVGDGGNEIGMGSIDPGIVVGNIRNGAEIACATPCDHLIVSGVSNWGGFALAAALAYLT
ncbi:MAG: glutamate cyclase domain-containing protein, partial [Pseudomonadota bacterium]